MCTIPTQNNNINLHFKQPFSRLLRLGKGSDAIIGPHHKANNSRPTRQSEYIITWPLVPTIQLPSYDNSKYHPSPSENTPPPSSPVKIAEGTVAYILQSTDPIVCGSAESVLSDRSHYVKYHLTLPTTQNNNTHHT